jgi:hypothetical protein
VTAPRALGWIVAAAVTALAPLPADALAPAPGADALRARMATLADKLDYNQFRRPLHMESKESPDGVSGDIYAIVDHPFASAAAALSKPGEWCELLLLHLNNKFCRASTEAGKTLLRVNIGKKHDQPLDETYRVEFAFDVAAAAADYLQVTLSAAEGPFGTRGYRIAFEATPAAGGKTFMHLAYSYSYGLAGRIAIQAYLGSAGRDKVGFTLVAKERGSQPHFIDGLRGVVERNTMRYYLAIEAYLGALSVPVAARQEKGMRDWFAAVERYPRQLHELGSAEYLEMKRREYSRQRAG